MAVTLETLETLPDDPVVLKECLESVLLDKEDLQMQLEESQLEKAEVALESGEQVADMKIRCVLSRLML